MRAQYLICILLLLSACGINTETRPTSGAVLESIPFRYNHTVYNVFVESRDRFVTVGQAATVIFNIGPFLPGSLVSEEERTVPAEIVTQDRTLTVVMKCEFCVDQQTQMQQIRYVSSIRRSEDA